ncbi:MAG: VOC family protein [Synechococcaceae cyanobacterium]
MVKPIFHLSIPVADLEDTRRWYVEGLGCGVGRCSAHALILELGGHQLVAQKQLPSQRESPQQGIYPRHFGLVFPELAAWQALVDRARAARLRFAVEPKIRFLGEATEHHTCFLIDPSGNWLEFKHYSHADAVLGCHGIAVVGDDSQRPEAQRLRARLLEFLKFRVLAAQEGFFNAGPGPSAPSADAMLAWFKPWLVDHWPEALTLSDHDLLTTLDTARRLYVN